MKKWYLVLINFILLMIGLIINILFDNNKNLELQLWIIILIYSFILFFIALLNGTALAQIDNIFTRKFYKSILGLIPIIAMIGFITFSDDILEYIGMIGILPIFITYLIWMSKIVRAE